MTQNGVVRFAGHLDPTAQEFRPTYPHHLHQLTFFSPPPPPPPLQPPFFHHQNHDVLFQQLPPFLNPQPPQQQQPSYIPPSMPPTASSPTRALLLSAVSPDVSESCIRRDMEVFGDVRAVQMERVREGIVTVHFYDLRASHAALNAVREQHMQQQHRLRVHFSSGLGPPPAPPLEPGVVSGRAVWAHFTIPTTHGYPDGLNQGTLVIFNLDPNVSAPTLRDIFNPFGEVKELRETPMKRQQRFVEFYDVRDAAKALVEMNGKEINGKSVVIEYSRPGGHSNKKFLNHHHHHHNNPSNFNSHFSNSASNNFLKPRLSPSSPPPPPPPPLQPPQVRILPYRNRKSCVLQQKVVRRGRRSPSSEDSVEGRLGRMSLRSDSENVNQKRVISNGGSKKANSPRSKQEQPKGSRGWKGKHKVYDPRYMIKEDAIIDVSDDCKDMRTTVMIKNIPNKYSQKLVLNMLDNHCIHCNQQIGDANDQPLSSYDFVYLPIDFNNKCNVGYGFVNMTSPEATLRLYQAFHHQHWEVFNSRKICEVTYARIQGLEALKEHFKNSKFACENEEYLPVVFNPPRDGHNKLTTPLPIVFTNTLSNSADVDGVDLTSTTSTVTHPTSTSSHDFDHDDGAIEEDDDEVSRSSSDGGGDVINDDDDMMDEGLQ